MAYRKGKWLVAFNTKTIYCDIDLVEDQYVISFDTSSEKVTLQTKNLDNAFKMIEGLYTGNSSPRIA